MKEKRSAHDLSPAPYRHGTEVNLQLREKFQEAKQHENTAEDFLREFLDRFLSADTKRAYQGDLLDFFKFVSSGGENIQHPGDLKAFHFQIYRDEMMKQGKASATINRKLVAIRSFMKWALAAKLIEHNPLDVVRLPKIQTESPTQAFDDDEVALMLEQPDPKTHTGRLHRFAMILLFNLGLRRSELAGLSLNDFQNQRGHFVLRVHGKGDKIRLIPITSTVNDELQHYLAGLNELGVELEPNEFLLQADPVKRRGQKMDGSTIYRLIEKYARKLGINKRVSPHSCRATVISHLLDTQRTPIRDVAIFAGHANVTTTERYDKRRQNLDQSAAYDVDFLKLKKA